MHLDEIIKRKSHEKILHVIRRHWITYIPTVLLYIFLGLLPIAIYWVLIQNNPTLIDDEQLRVLLIIGWSAYELAVALFFYTSFLIYYLDLLIVTNKRLIVVQQHNLFSRSVSELDIYKVQDITSEVHGVIPTMFNYGTVHIQTASEVDHFKFEAVARPHDLRRELMDLTDQDKKIHANSAANNHGLPPLHHPVKH